MNVWSAQGSLNITTTSLAFFQVFDSSAAVGTYASSTSTYTTVTSAIKTYADGFIDVVAEYTPSGGGLAEQYSKTAGTPLSAVDLTWSYASALTAFEARNGTKFASWGAAGLTVPSTCSTGGGGSSGSTVAVTFNVDATTTYGRKYCSFLSGALRLQIQRYPENIYITGSVDALEDWSPDNALLLSSANYPTWSITVNLPASTTIQYKYINKEGSTVTWESDPNMEITTPATGTYTANDSWR